MAVASAAGARVQPFITTLSFAGFRKDTLEYCSDMTLTVAPPDVRDPGWKPEKMYNLRDALGDAGVELKKTCGEQFTERPVLATCEATLRKGIERSELKISEKYYDSVAIVRSDRYMKECLRVGGEWKVVAQAPRKSDERQLDDALRDLRESTTIN